jgi:4-diphosphocytidyl-2-C-methyl-D-erythritol kinase
MNKLFNCGIGLHELIAMGKSLGADVPYCLKGGTVLAEGIGEILSELKSIPTTHVVLAVPKISVSTKWVYENLNLGKVNKRPDIDLLLRAIKECNIQMLSENMVNVLETVTSVKFGIINTIKYKLKELGALGSLMSGSGPSVFGLFSDKNSALNAYAKLKCTDCYLFLTETT